MPFTLAVVCFVVIIGVVVVRLKESYRNMIVKAETESVNDNDYMINDVSSEKAIRSGPFSPSPTPNARYAKELSLKELSL